MAVLPRPGSSLFRFCTLLLCGAMWLPGVTSLSAQGLGPASQSRQGFWYHVGLGQGFTGLACGICGGERESGGFTGYARAGGTMTEAFLLGGELGAWRRRQGDVSEHLETAGIAAWWYPKPAHGWFLKLGVGVTRYRANEGDEHLVASLFSGSAGTGYEMRVNPVLSIVPFLNLLATPGGNMNREVTANGGYHADRVADDLRVLVLQVGIGVTRH